MTHDGALVDKLPSSCGETCGETLPPSSETKPQQTGRHPQNLYASLGGNYPHHTAPGGDLAPSHLRCTCLAKGFTYILFANHSYIEAEVAPLYGRR